MGIDLENDTEAIRPIFKRGPRDEATVLWVCITTPEIYGKIIQAKWVYIGLLRCKVKEYYDYTQCAVCCKYGHKAVTCRSKVMCAHCGESGHKKNICKLIEQEPVCCNCGVKHEAIYNICKARTRAINFAVRSTNYTV